MRRPPAIAGAVARGLAPFRGERAAQLVPQARLAGPMPWVIAIMVALTVIAAAGGLALNNLAEQARAGLSGGATVQIVEALPRERERQARAAEEILSQHPQVASLRRVPAEELEALLEPWLGAGGVSDTVPVPALIDIQLRGAADDARVASLQAALADSVPAARVDAQSGWLRPVFGAINSLQWLAIALVVLLAGTAAAAVWLASRTALGTNRDTIEIVHLLGGTDSQIARIFQRSVAVDAALGGAVGLGLGLAATLTLANRFSGLDSGLVAGGGLGPADWAAIAAIPLVGVALAWLTARVTVLAALRKML